MPGRGPIVRRRRLIALAALAVVVVTAIAACGGAASPPAGSPFTSAAPSQTPSAEPSAAASEAPASPSASAAPASLPETPLVAVLDRTFASPGATFDSAKMGGLDAGDLIAHWFIADGSYVVAYAGLDLAETGPLCPGNSLQVEGGFQHVTNMPTAEGACANVETLSQPPIGPRMCGDQVLYLTAIPADAKGILWASINSQQPDGSYVGLSGTVDGRTATAPAIDLDALGCQALA
jgi:hypothetical protein